MKNSLLLSGLFVGILFLWPSESQSQWQPDVRLTNDPATSNTSNNNARCIATSGDSVHIVWIDFRDGANPEVYYKRSIDGGISWEQDTRLTNDPAWSLSPSIFVSSSVVHIVWQDERDGNAEIYYKRSTDGGVSWGQDTRLTNDSANSWSPSMSVSGPVLHIVWQEDRDGNPEIYYKRSTDGGVSWEQDTRLTNDPADSWFPCISVSSSEVHVVWHDNRDENAEIFYKRSTDGGLSWGLDIQLTNEPINSSNPSLFVSGSVVHVVWQDDRDGIYGPPEIYYKRSTDGGISWEQDTRLTNEPGLSEYPSIFVSGSVVHVLWQDDRDGPSYEIYYKRSTDGGVSWEQDTRLTNDPAYSYSPFIFVSGLVAHVVWGDDRDGNWEIYYKRNPTGNVTGIENIASESPEEFRLEQNYPNPFNPSTTLEFSLTHRAFVTIKVYNILGKEIATIVSQELSPGRYSVPWNATSFPSGVYSYRLQAGQFSQTKKLILIR